MLGNRNITLTKGIITLRGICDSGCPQGELLSFLLWSLMIDELWHLLTDQGCHPIGYADDILVIVRGMHLDALMWRNAEDVESRRHLVLNNTTLGESW